MKTLLICIAIAVLSACGTTQPPQTKLVYVYKTIEIPENITKLNDVPAPPSMEVFTAENELALGFMKQRDMLATYVADLLSNIQDTRTKHFQTLDYIKKAQANINNGATVK